VALGCDPYAALDTHDDYSIEEPAPSAFTATYIAHTLRNYRNVILLSVLAVAVGYLILAMAAYLLAPAVRLTALPFRLEFTGADRGQYPNGSKFSSSEIISIPVLLETYKQNELERFTTFTDFAGAVFVVESNEAREALAREYQARLSDTRLTSIDRERIQREYELKAGSLSKNQFSVNYMRRRRDNVPEVMAKKVLHDILKNWAHYAATEQHVLEHQVAVLSPEIIAPQTALTGNAILTTVILRGNVSKLIENIRDIREMPNAILLRTKDGMTLDDISLQLENVLRYRLDPLVDRIAAARLDDRGETLRFLTTQLDYDTRTLEWHVNAAETARRTLDLYINAQSQRAAPPVQIATASPRDQTAAGGSDNETLMPQLSDTFIDRLIQLTSRQGDNEFRQKMAEEYQKASLAIGPAEAAVAYDKTALESVRSSGGTTASADANQIRQELEATRLNVRQLAMKVQEIHKLVSRNLNPSTELVIASTPRTRVDRSLSLKFLILLGMLLTLVSLVASILLSLFHSRVRDGEKEESAALAQSPSATLSR
jgi:hypothetical protein